MSSSTFLTRSIVLLAFAVLTVPAMAKSGFIFIGSGEKTVGVAPLNQEMRNALGPSYGPEYVLGFNYKTIAVFGLDIWTWGGGYCIFNGERCDTVSAARSAVVLGVDEDELPRPWSYTLKPGLILAIALAIGLYVWAWRRQQALLMQPSASDDPRYQRALEIVLEGSKQLPLSEQGAATHSRLEAGVRYLVEQGIEESEARSVLSGQVATVLEFRRRTSGHRQV